MRSEPVGPKVKGRHFPTYGSSNLTQCYSKYLYVQPTRTRGNIYISERVRRLLLLEGALLTGSRRFRLAGLHVVVLITEQQ